MYTEHLNTDNPKTLPEKILAWVEREFNAKYVDRVFNDLLDVATGNKEGNEFEKQAVKRILKT